MKSGYIPTLDGWRALAIVGVVGAHALGHVDGALFGLKPTLVLLGQDGVDVFFAISGFLITRRLLEEERERGAISLRAFYVRRAFRILPPALAYLALVGFCGAVSLLPVSRGEIVSSTFFARNYLSSAHIAGPYTGHFWSLAVEEHLYLLWPALLVVMGQRRARLVVPLLILGFSAWRHIESHHGYLLHLLPDVNATQRTDTRADSLLCGCMVALLIQIPSVEAWCRRVLIAPVLLVLGAIYLALVVGLVSMPMVITARAMLAPILIVATVLHPGGHFGRLLELPLLRWVGKLSYSLYLWQQLFIVGDIGVAPALRVAGLVLAAGASYVFVEQPMIRLGRRLVRT